MADVDDRMDEYRADLGAWLARQAETRWPDAELDYRGRARQGNHRWHLRVPGVGEFWVAASDDALARDEAVRRAEAGLESADWLERFPDVPTHGLIVKGDGRVFQWNPDRDDETGSL